MQTAPLGLQIRAFLLALAGIVCMGLAEGLSWIAAFLGLLLAVGYWMALVEKRSLLESRGEKRLILFAFGLCILEFLARGFSREAILFPLGHFLAACQCTKAYKRREPEDYPTILVMSLVHIMLAVVFPPGPVTMISVVLVLLLLPGALHQLAGERVRIMRPESQDRRGRFPAGLLVYPLTALVFLSLPRDRSYMKWDVPGSWGRSGFGTRFILGDLSTLFPNDEVVMRVQASFPSRWRGMSYDTYDHGEWKVSHPESQVFRSSEETSRGDFSGIPAGHLVQSQTYMLERSPPDDVLFASLIPLEISLQDGQLSEIDELGNVHARSRIPSGARYRVVSSVPSPSIGQLREDNGPIPDEILQSFSAPPEIPPEVVTLARTITENVSGIWDKANAVETYLQENATYSLSPGQAEGDPVAWFLFKTRKGTCEHFASAMTVLLQCSGSPARVVTGFQSGAMLQGDLFLVRQSDAHAWVEVYFPASGWVAFDPTPMVGGPDFLKKIRRWIATWVDMVKVRWFRYVVNFSSWNQQRIREWLLKLSSGSTHLWRHVLERISYVSPTRWEAALLGLCGLGVLILLFKPLWLRFFKALPRLRITRSRRLSGHDRHARAALVFYEAVLSVLEKKGFVRRGHQTGWEFFNSVSGLPPEAREDFKWITDLYVAVRFGQRPLNEDEERRAGECLRRLKEG